MEGFPQLWWCVVVARSSTCGVDPWIMNPILYDRMLVDTEKFILVDVNQAFANSNDNASQKNYSSILIGATQDEALASSTVAAAAYCRNAPVSEHMRTRLMLASIRPYIEGCCIGFMVFCRHTHGRR